MGFSERGVQRTMPAHQKNYPCSRRDARQEASEEAEDRAEIGKGAYQWR